jgi:hypothetical protein
MRLRLRAAHRLVLLGALVTSACATEVRGVEPASVDALKTGQWGGPHIAMTVAAARTDIEFDCARAIVTGTITTDRDGAFTSTGTFQPERPGPTTPDAPPQRPMRLTGTVKGDDMQVKVVLTDTDEDAGSFTLGFGAAPRLFKCR